MSATQQEFEDDSDWTERFIQAVQSRPAIYNSRLPEHSDRHLVSRLWSEIYSTMVHNWEQLTVNEKSAKGKDLQSEWINLRTCFRREYMKQKKGSSGQAANKRRKYIYFDQLLFLLPTMEDRPTVSECSPIQVDNSESEDDSRTVQTTDQSQDDDHNKTSEPGTSTRTKQRAIPTRNRESKKKTPSYEDSLSSILKEKKEGVIDEDKSFLLSLVSAFKKLTDTEKLDAKMEFLATLKRMMHSNQDSFNEMPHRYRTHQNYGHPNFAGISVPRPHPYHMYNVENSRSGSSTPIPVASEISRGSRASSFDPHSPLTDFLAFT